MASDPRTASSIPFTVEVREDHAAAPGNLVQALASVLITMARRRLARPAPARPKQRNN
jgi:hypothetical protein